MIKALLGGGMYLLFMFGIFWKWQSKRKSQSTKDKLKGMPSPDAYEQIDDPIATLSHASWQMRLNAAQRLLAHPTAEAIPMLVKTLEDSDPDVRQCASDVLIKLGEDTISEVIEVLEDGSLDARISAVHILAAIESPEILEALSHAILHDSSVWVRLPAIQALTHYPSVLTTDTLIKALRDENREVYETVVTLLREIGTYDALQAIETYPYSGSEKSRTQGQSDEQYWTS